MAGVATQTGLKQDGQQMEGTPRAGPATYQRHMTIHNLLSRRVDAVDAYVLVSVISGAPTLLVPFVLVVKGKPSKLLEKGRPE